MSLSVVCWRWGTRYGVEFINRLHSGLTRHLHLPHQLYCITDDPTGLAPGIIPVPIWPAEGLGRCRRLRIFDPGMESLFGDRILQMDIDCVITADITPLIDRPEPLVIWRNVPDRRYAGDVSLPNPENGKGAYNTSLLLQRTGVLGQAWADYCRDRPRIEEAAKRAGMWTLLEKSLHGVVTSVLPIESGDDDQAIISLYARPLNPPIWGEKDGVYKWGRRGFADKTKLPENARIVFFNGSVPENLPGNPRCEVPAWIEEHWK